MRLFLRKALGATITLLLVVGIFWDSLIASAFWGSAVYQTWGNSAATLESTKERLLVGTTTDQSTPFNSLLIPQLFASTTIFEETKEIIVVRDANSNKYFLASPMTALAAGLQSGSTAADCDMYDRILNINPCDSNQAFMAALATSTINSTHLFSNQELKTTTAVFRTLRATYLPFGTQTITPFNTVYVTGYLATTPNKSIAYFFDLANKGYEFTFINMDPEEIDSVLSGLSTDSQE